MSHIVKSPTRAAFNTIDLKGQRFGHLLVVKRSEGSRLKYVSSAFWQCLCDCGEPVDESSRRLRSGHAAACGKSSCRFPSRATGAPTWVKPKPEQVAITKIPSAPSPPRPVTTEEFRRIVNSFLASGFRRAEAEEMARMGVVVIGEEVAA